MSGFFASRKKEVVEKAPLKPRGYKILLEVLGKGTWEKDKEIPFEFVDREVGSSKLKIKTIIEYAQQVLDITLYSFPHHQSAAWREWKRVLSSGLWDFGDRGESWDSVFPCEFFAMNKDLASPFAIEFSILNNFIWNDLWTFSSVEDQKVSSRLHRLITFNIVSVGGAVINYGIFLVLTSWFAVYYMAAQFIGILIAFVWNFLVNRRMTWQRENKIG